MQQLRSVFYITIIGLLNDLYESFGLLVLVPNQLDRIVFARGPC